MNFISTIMSFLILLSHADINLPQRETTTEVLNKCLQD